jgi:hypothetical protein
MKIRGMGMAGERPTWGERLGQHGWLIGVVALAAWLALLWFMFGDVL